MTASDPSPQPGRPRFRDVALASGLVTEEQLAAAEALLRSSTDVAALTPEEYDRLLMEALVTQGVITRYQGKEMMAGRSRFRLGQYTVLDKVGKGGMGHVFKAEHSMMGRVVAVKVLPRSKATPESEAAFRREMRILGRLDHENLVRAFDGGYDAMVYYLVTELVPGLDLKRQIRAHGTLDEVTAASVFSQAARGLAHAHEQGVVHRDVKPGNILVMDDGRVKVLDMGLAGSTLAAEEMRLGRVVGTMDYIAPEQTRSPDDVGPEADIYGLGCTLYYALTGEVPFPGGTPQEKMRRHRSESPRPVQSLAPHVSEPFCRVVEAMMAKSPVSRVSRAADVVDLLARWTPERPLPPPRGKRTARSGSLRPSAAAGEPSSSQSPAVDWEPRTAPTASGSVAGQSSIVERAMAVARFGWGELTSPSSRAALAASAAVLVPAVAAGLLAGGLMEAVRGFDPEWFQRVFGSWSPATFGRGAVLLTAALRLLAGRSQAGH